MSRPPIDSGGDARGLVLISTAVAQMVVPVLIGAWLDRRYDWSPWGMLVGAAVGFGGGVTALVWKSRGPDHTGGKPPTGT